MRALAERNLLVGRRSRSAASRVGRVTVDVPAEITIRRAGEGDEAKLACLAQLDSTRLLEGPALVAERNGALVAAISLTGGRTVADPFVATAPYVELLGLRAAAMGAR